MEIQATSEVFVSKLASVAHLSHECLHWQQYTWRLHRLPSGRALTLTCWWVSEFCKLVIIKWFFTWQCLAIMSFYGTTKHPKHWSDLEAALGNRTSRKPVAQRVIRCLKCSATLQYFWASVGKRTGVRPVKGEYVTEHRSPFSPLCFKSRLLAKCTLGSTAGVLSSWMWSQFPCVIWSPKTAAAPVYCCPELQVAVTVCRGMRRVTGVSAT